MISRNPKYVEPKPGTETTATKLTWLVALIVPIFVAILSLAALRTRNDIAPGRLDAIQEQFFLLASGVLLLGSAYIANLLAKKGANRWAWIGLIIVATAPTLTAYVLRVEFARLMMAAGSSVLIWIAVVAPAFHRSITKSPKESESIREPNGN